MNKERKKLLVFHTKIAPYRVDFFNKLASLYDMSVCIDRRVVYGGLYKNLEIDYHFEYGEFCSKDGFFKTILYIKKEINTHCPDTIMVSECGLVSLVVLLVKYLSKKKYRVISIIDDSYDQLINNRQFSKKHEVAEKILIPKFDQVINVEPRVTSFFQLKYKKGIYFPIIRDEIKYRKELNDALPISREYIQKYNLDTKAVVLFVGRFVAIKNVISIINVVQSLRDDNVRLVLVGAGPEELEYKKIADSTRVIFAGQQSGLNLYAWYNVADIFTLASLQEPFGAVINEALMSGCKCIVSDRAGSSCLIKEGENGYICNPTDANDIKEKLEYLLKEINCRNKVLKVKTNMMRTTFKDEFNKVIHAI